jgi:hypothetical protein
MPVDLMCEAAVLAGRLKHSWLENQVLNKSGRDILEMRREGPWSGLDVQFPRRVREALDLAGALDDAFSPAQLVDRLLVFAHLSGRDREMLRSAVHSAYLARIGMRAREGKLAKAVAELSIQLDQVRALWQNGSESDLERAWCQTLQLGARLRDELDALPKTIALP